MATLLKNLYSQEFIEKLSISLQDKYKNFKKDEFKKAIFTNAWEDFELKQRMRHISITQTHLTNDQYNKGEMGS